MKKLPFLDDEFNTPLYPLGIDLVLRQHSSLQVSLDKFYLAHTYLDLNDILLWNTW